MHYEEGIILGSVTDNTAGIKEYHKLTKCPKTAVYSNVYTIH